MNTKTKRVRLDEESFARVEQMISSSDKGNRIMALNILNACDLKSSMARILFLLKTGGMNGLGWEHLNEHAPLLVGRIRRAGLTEKENLTSAKIFSMLIANGCPGEELEFCRGKIVTEVQAMLDRWGYEFCKIDLKFTIPDGEEKEDSQKTGDN